MLIPRTSYFWAGGVLMLALLQGLFSEVEGQWSDAHATCYGGLDASGTNNAACGYANAFSMGYGSSTTALSEALFNNVEACGGCYEVQCIDDPTCTSDVITVTVINYCPQGSYGGWCDAPKIHFDLACPAFEQIAELAAGHVPILYQKVTCSKTRGIDFLVNGQTYFMNVLVYNVGGAGDVSAVSVKGDNSDSIQMTRNWGQYWEIGYVLDGQALSFSVTTGNDKTVISYNVAPSNWQYGQTFEGSQF